ncbi:MAG TPA: 5'/3'-nucleotidase SurE [Bdellovibrionales bacterium]|nr:MAG: 5'/3'-nucleotidase SurE [Bdellovibrionales bacterium GWB1_52_6]OFZ03693.1 MAG: 5'/3'-nucleotidase SurE [Bdellovibrionales bacterium GWA1_52_35]HAR44076.1 5'/3'-nucleotidase SurE [Bdellovibrionales bacterium]HCM38796.1 5'/3'-nucleotidase SurE [Bdellovibrionales bacterium]
MRILLSNDDGIHAPGLKALYRELKKLGEVWVVAPLEEQSATGHSLTIHKPLRILKMDQPRCFGVSGSPADCVYLGIREVMKLKPDVVVSGINRGANLGQDVYYSGTVSAAREASIFGFPSLAVSLDVSFTRSRTEELLHYETAAKYAMKVLRAGYHLRVPPYSFLNLNVPDVSLSKVKGLEMTRQGFRYYTGSILRRKDHRGRDYYWVGGKYRGYREEDGSDCAAVAAGYASLTPMKLDSTDLEVLLSPQNTAPFSSKKIKRRVAL